MKLFKKVKNVFLTMGVIMISLPTKIFAATRDAADVYGPPEDYLNKTGTPKLSPSSVGTELSLFWKIIFFICIPIVFIVGAITFFKKSKLSTTAKIISIICAIIVVTLICVGIYFGILNN